LWLRRASRFQCDGRSACSDRGGLTFDRERLLALERVEILAKLDGHEGAPNAAREQLGLVLQRVGGAWAFGRTRDTSLHFNRVMGLGLERPGSLEDLVALKAFYAEHGIPVFRIALSPAAEPAGFETTLKAAGFGTNTHLVKWVRDVSPLKTTATALRIELALPGEVEAMGEVLIAAFGGRPQSVPLASALVGRPHWHHYVAKDGGTLVAAAAMYVREGFAWLGAAGTLISHRGRGAQSALIARRIEDARSLGCHSITLETAPDQPEKPNPSYHNIERAGFQVVYCRPSWEFPDPGTRSSKCP
jgi:GNAT superfamily N-acetyltransferase